MKYYQITFNNLEGFDPGLVHSVITKTLNTSDWWHYLPSAYIIGTAVTPKYLADKIIELLPGLNFLIIEIDINNFNGYLDKKAWEWLNKKARNRGATYVPHASSPLADLLSTVPAAKRSDLDIANEALNRILGTGRNKK